MQCVQRGTVAVLGLILIGLAACGGTDDPRINPDAVTPEGQTRQGVNTQLLPFGSEQAFKQALAAGLKNMAQPQYAVPEIALADTGATIAASSSSSVSQTNVQVAGVDEADRMKSDGQYLYALVEQPPEPSAQQARSTMLYQPRLSLAVTRLANEAQAPARIDALELPQEQHWQSLYHYAPEGGDASLLVQGSDLYGYGIWYDYGAWGNSRVYFQWLPIQSDGRLSRDRQTLGFDGGLVSSRRVGDTLYLALRQNPHIPGWITYAENAEQEAQNQARLDQASSAEMVPHWRLNDADQGPLVSHGDCYSTVSDDELQRPTLVTLVAFDLKQRKVRSARCLVGPVDTLYLTPKSLYVAASEPNYAGPWGSSFHYPESHSSHIHKFALSASALDYVGSTDVQGHFGWDPDKMPFRFGEHNDVLTVVTTEEKNGDPVHRLYNLGAYDDKSFARMAELPNAQRPEPIGKPGEQLYAVRHFGDRAYLVTFQQTDPLYVVDTSQARDPKVLGELEVTGFSDYLHPLSDDLLLGVGLEATAGLGDFAMPQGVKISLFDVSDPRNPTEVDKRVIGHAGSHAGVSIDHHAFALLPKGKGRDTRIALPVYVFEGGEQGPFIDLLHTDYKAYRAVYLYELPSLQSSGARLVDAGHLRVDDFGGYYFSADRALLTPEHVYMQGSQTLYYAPWQNPGAVEAVR